MREGKFELIAASIDKSFSDLKPFEERVINGSVYAVALPGQEYCVKVNIYRDEKGNFTPKRLRIGLYVDGNDVQYWKRIDLTKEHLLPTVASVPVSATFWGFKKNVTDIRSFQFAATKISETADDSSTSDSGPLGQIHVVIYEAMVVGGTFQNKCGSHDIPIDRGISEGKKFWQQASLSTSGGRKLPLNLEQFDELEKWINVDQREPLYTMTLNYHTGLTLDCIESLSYGSDYNIGTVGGKRTICSDRHEQQQTKRTCEVSEIFDLTEEDDDGQSIIAHEQVSDVQEASGQNSSRIANPEIVLTVRSDETIYDTVIGTILDTADISKIVNKDQEDIDVVVAVAVEENEDEDEDEDEEGELTYEDEEKEILYITPVPKEITVIDLIDDDDDDDNNNNQ